MTQIKQKCVDAALDQRLFTLAEADWKAFVSGLDEPPAANEKLKALLSRSPIWGRK